ncbi:MAG: quinol dehydrogenase ferredoxin subunit NapH [Thermodesulfovibrionales bacterium]
MAQKWLILRRITQLSIFLLFIAGNLLGWTVLRGDLSAGKLLDTVPLTDPFAILQILAAGSLLSLDALAGGLIVLLFYSLLAGRAFCGWVCPMNMVTDGANRLRRSLGWKTDGWRVSSRTRYWIMAMALVLSPILGVAAFEWISPVSILHRGLIYGMGMGWTAVAAVFLFDLMAVRNGFCGHLCPLGGFWSLIGRFSLIRVRHNREQCSLCMDCVNICPERQVLGMVGKESGPLLSGECLNCGRCIDVCETKAMKWGTRFGKDQQSAVSP